MVERLVGYSKLHSGVLNVRLTIICFIDTIIFLTKATPPPPTPTIGFFSRCCRADTELEITSICYEEV